MVVRDIVRQRKGTIFDRLVHAYVDDVDIIARNLRSLTEAVEMLKVARNVGLEINVTKTKYLKSGRADGLKKPPSQEIGQQAYEHVSEVPWFPDNC